MLKIHALQRDVSLLCMHSIYLAPMLIKFENKDKHTDCELYMYKIEGLVHTKMFVTKFVRNWYEIGESRSKHY